MANRFEQFATPSAGGSTNRFRQFAQATAPEPPADPLYSQELAKAKASFDQPRVPAPEGIGAPATPEQAAAEGIAHQRGQEAEKAAFDATRTLGRSAVDTIGFAASLPVRAVTKGEYGIGDFIEPVDPKGADAFRRAETGFAGAYQAELETAAAAGDVMAGIPFLNTMGGVPGQVMRTGAAAVRDAPRMVNKLLRDDRGAGLIPGVPQKGFTAVYDKNGGYVAHMNEQGRKAYEASQQFTPANSAAGGTPPGAPPPPPAGSPPATPPQNRLPQAARLPNRAETFAASERLDQGLGAKVDIPEMVADHTKQKWAAGIRSIPLGGDPIDAMYTKGLGQLEMATKTAGETLGTPVGREAAGEGLKQGALAWMTKNSKEHLESLYEPVYANIDVAATSPLPSTTRLANGLVNEMREAATKSELQALGLVEEAATRPEGLTVRGLARKRTEIGDALDESAINKSPAQRALKRAYGALTDDLRAAIRQHGGDEALTAWDAANREARVVSIQRKRLSKVVGTDENKLSGGDVFNKAVAIAQEKAGNSKAIDQLMDVVGEKQRGDFGAQLLEHMGMNPKTELFSADRLLSEYNKLSGHAKQRYFGAAKQHLDDITIIAKKFSELGSKFNHSNTGIVNAVLKIMNNPASIAVHTYASPMSAAVQGVGLLGIRQVAWSLAKPSSARQASRVFRETYRVALAKAAGHGAEAVAKREQALSQAVRAFSMEAARQTGGKAADIEAELTKAVKGQAMGKPTQADLLKSSAWSESHAALKTSLAEDFPKGAARFKGNPEALRAFKGLQEKVSSIVKGGDRGDFSSADDLLSAALRDADALDKAAPGATSKLYTQYVRLAARKRGLKK